MCQSLLRIDDVVCVGTCQGIGSNAESEADPFYTLEDLVYVGHLRPSQAAVRVMRG